MSPTLERKVRFVLWELKPPHRGERGKGRLVKTQLEHCWRTVQV